MACVSCSTHVPPFFRTTASRAAAACHLDCLAASFGERDRYQHLLMDAAASDAPHDRVEACVRYLLDHGAILEPDGRWPIEQAVRTVHRPAVVRALLQVGAKADTYHRPTPLEVVCDPAWVESGMPPETVECALLLVRAGARVWTGRDGPLGVAIRCGEVALLQAMLNAGASRAIATKHLAAADLPDQRHRELEAVVDAAFVRPQKRRRSRPA